MNHITLRYDSPNFRRIPYNGHKVDGMMISPTQEVTEWFREMGLPLRYEQLWYSAHGLNKSQSPTLRFIFDDEKHALLFKLAWGGDHGL